MIATVKITDHRHSYDAIVKYCKTYKKGVSLTGYFQGNSEGTAESNADKAIQNEFGTTGDFGTQKIPARPFVRTYFDANVDKLDRLAKKEFRDSLLGKTDVKTALQTIGLYVKAGIQRQIDATLTPPNAPYTIMKKGSSHPLIDTGQMRSSVRNKEIIGDKVYSDTEV